MTYHLFTTSQKAWSAMLTDIAGARHSIYLEMYILADDVHGQDFLLALSAASKRGVKVILVLDVLGSYSLDKKFVQQLRTAGVEVLFFSFFFRRNHRKIMIVDETFAYIGGVNIGTRYKTWKDLQVRVVGHVVGPIIKSFAKVYKECGGKDRIMVSNVKDSILKRAKLWFIERGIGRSKHELRTYYEGCINSAKSSIVIVTPYLFPPRWLIAIVHQAILRGVQVEILIPRYTDYWTINHLSFVYASFFTSLGARCYFSPGMNHAKAVLIDGREGAIGSQNFDALSFDWNSEAGVFFHEPDMVADLSNIISTWKDLSQQLGKGRLKVPWYYVFTTFLLRAIGLMPLWW